MRSFLEYVSDKKVSSIGNIKHALVDEDAKTKKIIEKICITGFLTS